MTHALAAHRAPKAARSDPCPPAAGPGLHPACTRPAPQK